MIFKFKKLNLCNFFPIFLCLSAPAFFPFRWHLRTRHPSSTPPAFPPFIFSFRRDPSQPHPPSNFPTFPSFSPLPEHPTGRIYTKNQTVLFKIEVFPGGIITCTEQEEGAFQGDFRVFLLEESASFGEVLGVRQGRILGTFTPKDHPEREKIRETPGWKNRCKKGPAAICYEPFSGCHYSRDFMRVLFQTVSKLVSVFFKTNTLSEHFVTLSAERCPFPA